MYKLWVDVDENGRITRATGGYADYIVPPEEEYMYEFTVSGEVFKNTGSYRVVDGQLVKDDGNLQETGTTKEV